MVKAEDMRLEISVGSEFVEPSNVCASEALDDLKSARAVSGLLFDVWQVRGGIGGEWCVARLRAATTKKIGI